MVISVPVTVRPVTEPPTVTVSASSSTASFTGVSSKRPRTHSSQPAGIVTVKSATDP